MTLTLTSKFNVAFIDDLQVYFDSFGKEVEAAADVVGKRILPDFQDELLYYPPELPNQQYVRTFNLRRGTSVTYVASGDGLVFLVRSTAPYDIYVRGTFNQRSRTEAVRTIARIHRGRWIPLYDIVTFWQQTAKEEFLDQIKAQYGDFVNTTLRRRSRIR